MQNRECTSCNLVKPIDEFDFQRKNPTKRYAWCNPCRAQAGRDKVARNMRPNNGYLSEVKDMRRKAMQLRKLTDAQILEAKSKVASGLSQKAVAAEMGVSQSVISKAVKGIGTYKIAG